MAERRIIAGAAAWLFFAVLFTGSDAQCGYYPEILNARLGYDGTLSSPGYPQNYSNFMSCGWKIRTDLNYVVRLHVISLDLQQESTCDYDSLSVYDAGSEQATHLVEKLCGNLYDLPYIYSSGPNMYIKFRSDGSETRAGFLLKYTAVRSPITTTTTTTTITPRLTSCGSEGELSPATLTAQYGHNELLSSPNYPSDYPNNVRCGWKIMTEEWNYIVRLHVLHMNLEYEDTCDYDSLSVYDADSPQNNDRLAKLCGVYNSSSFFFSSGRYMYIDFLTDGSNTNGGFQLQYTAVRTHPGCDGSPHDLYASVGQYEFLVSPNFPWSYFNNMDCRWRIRADWNYVVHLSVMTLDLEGESTCSYDSLSIYDADSPLYDERLAKLCGTRNNTPSIYSTGRYMYVMFKTDGSQTRRGFRLKYIAVRRPSTTAPTTISPGCCGADCSYFPNLHAHLDINGTLLSPNFPMDYSNNLQCGWKITADSNYVVRLYVSKLNLEQSSGCEYDSLSIYDSGSADYGRRLAKLCGIKDGLPFLYSSGRYMYIKFLTDGSQTRSGFRLIYTAARRSEIVPWTTTTSFPCCGADCSYFQNLHAHLDISGTLLSPNFPMDYSNNLQCGWKITADSNYVVRLYVSKLNLEQSSGCEYDSLSIYDSGSADYDRRLAKLCGIKDGLPFLYSSGRYMYIKFLTDGSQTRSGFRLIYTAARRSEIVPWTTTTSFPWGTGSTTSSSVFRHGAVIGSCSAGLVVFFCTLFVVFRFAMRRARMQRSTFVRLRTPNPNPNRSSSIRIRRQLRVFVIPNRDPLSADTGNENMAYSSGNENPPPYSSLQHTYIPPEAASPDIPATAPPAYEEAMGMGLHPPPNGAPAPSATVGTEQPTDAVPACPTNVPDQPEHVSQSSFNPAGDVDQGTASLSPDDTKVLVS